MALSAPPNERKRVKVYELRENDWFDRGTGFCNTQCILVRPILGSSKSAAFRCPLQLRLQLNVIVYLSVTTDIFLFL